jgi:hypothetical protein
MPNLEPTPEEIRWMNRLANLLKSQPETLAVFVGSGICVLRANENGGLPYYEGQGTGVDQGKILGSFLPKNQDSWDGGDW